MKKLMMFAFAAIAALGSFADQRDCRHGRECRHESERSQSVEDTHVWLVFGMSFITAPIQVPTAAYSVYGVMLDVGYGQVKDSYLVNAGLINNVTRTMCGVQVGPINLADDLFGVQGGIFNYADDAYGLQLGIVNFAGHLHGLQLGLLNLNFTGMPVFPIFNIGF